MNSVMKAPPDRCLKLSMLNSLSSKMVTRVCETKTPPGKKRLGPGKRKAPPPAASGFDEEPLLTSLPTECLVEVLKCLEIDELLVAAWTCKRVHQAAQDAALWDHSHFSIADWRAVLQRHFVEDESRRTKDHTGVWTRCVLQLTKVALSAKRARELMGRASRRAPPW